MTLEKKLAPLRARYKVAGEMEKKLIIRAVKQYKKEYGVTNTKSMFEETFETAKEVFGT